MCMVANRLRIGLKEAPQCDLNLFVGDDSSWVTSS